MMLETNDDAGWTPEEWTALNELARRTVADHAQLRTLLPEGPDAPNAYLVELPKLGPANAETGLTFEVATARKVTRLQVKFTIKSEQLHDLPRIRGLVQQVAMRLARLEDLVLALAEGARPALQPGSDFSSPPEKGLLSISGGRSGLDIVEALSDCA